MKPATHISAIAFALLTLASTSALADDDAGGLYLGGGAGYSGYKLDCSGPESCSKSKLGLKLLAGYQILPNFAIEGSYADLGKLKASDPGFRASLATHSFTIAALGIVPLSEEFQLFGKVGSHFSKTRFKAEYEGFRLSETHKGNGLLLGLGAQYKFTQNLAGRVEYERLNQAIRGAGEHGDINLVTASMIYQF